MDLDKEKIGKTVKLLNEFLEMNNIEPKIAFNAFFSLLATAMHEENISFREFRHAMIGAIDELKNEWN
jgi:hypothetical protein